MTTWLLFAAALILPGLWGWLVWELCRRIWPRSGSGDSASSSARQPSDVSPELPDFQI